mgnify:CR=1 FL=1
MGLAAWDGAHWTSLAHLPLPGRVSALAVHQGHLVVGGSFGNTSVVLCDGDLALPLGPLFGQATSLASIQGHLFAGVYSGLGGVLEWNGASWDQLDGGTNGDVASLLAIDDRLYVGGVFTIAGNHSSFGIARWDGLARSPEPRPSSHSSPAFPIRFGVRRHSLTGYPPRESASRGGSTSAAARLLSSKTAARRGSAFIRVGRPRRQWPSRAVWHVLRATEWQPGQDLASRPLAVVPTARRGRGERIDQGLRAARRSPDHELQRSWRSGRAQNLLTLGAIESLPTWSGGSSPHTVPHPAIALDAGSSPPSGVRSPFLGRMGRRPPESSYASLIRRSRRNR